MGPGSQLSSQMMEYEGTIRKNMKNTKKIKKSFFFSIDVESIPSVPGASGRVPGAPRHRKMMKIQFLMKKQFEAMNRQHFLWRFLW